MRINNFDWSQLHQLGKWLKKKKNTIRLVYYISTIAGMEDQTSTLIYMILAHFGLHY